MAKRSKNAKAKRSLSSVPRGLPQRKKRKGAGAADHAVGGSNPFEYARTTNSAARVKHQVHNRHVPGAARPGSSSGGGAATSALARSIQRRKDVLRAQLRDDKKSNAFIDRRIGESRRGGGSTTMTEDEKMLARIVRERARRSRKASKFALDDDDDDEAASGGGGLGLTHKGRAIDESYTGQLRDETDVILSDDDKDPYGGELDKVDTMMHFGGGAFDRDRSRSANPYGPGGGEDGGGVSIGDAYRSRKEELDDMIRRRKMQKAERMKSKEDQVEAFETMDESFRELASLLQFRDKEKERKEKWEAKKAGTLSEEDKEMDAWDKETKEYLFERKVKATDRTKTPEEIAQEEAERLHELETKRLARMNGDFEDDDLSDVSDEETKKKKPTRRKKNDQKKAAKKAKNGSAHKNPDELDSDVEDASEELETRFTADGLVYVDQEGQVVGKVGETNGDDASSGAESNDSSDSSSEDETPSGSDRAECDMGGSDDEASADGNSDSDNESSPSDSENDPHCLLSVGTRVQGNYRAEEQFDGKENWYDGTISKVRKDEKGITIYDITYDDGDFEDGMVRENLRPIKKTTKEKLKEESTKVAALTLKKKRKKAKEKARNAIPFVFEVPTTLEALNDMIATHASTGADASLIVQRIHTANSVRLNKKNKEKMQNFIDVLLKRFIAVGDRIFESGDGGTELQRYEQLNSLTRTLYGMAQDSPECAGAVWSRRLGIFQKAFAKKLRDSDFVTAEDADSNGISAWPSTGTLLLLRALVHIFPATDKRHPVVTPALILIGQILAQAPVHTLIDVTKGIFCSALMIEYTKGAKRIPPEALAFLSGVLRLFAADATEGPSKSPIPSLEAVCRIESLSSLRKRIAHASKSGQEDAITRSSSISLEKQWIEEDPMAPTAVLCSALHLIESTCNNLGGSLGYSEAEVFAEITQGLLCIDPRRKDLPLPHFVRKIVSKTASAVSRMCRIDQAKVPLLRRSRASASVLAIKSMAPRMEDPTRYAMSKDKGKSQQQAELDRNRREYKREHKAAARELRLDAAFIENERRKEKEKKDSKAREKRHKNFAWLEQEQATMNQQVRMGGGLLSGGGTGAARAKAATAKLGIKKGGKMR